MTWLPRQTLIVCCWISETMHLTNQIKSISNAYYILHNTSVWKISISLVGDNQTTASRVVETGQACYSGESSSNREENLLSHFLYRSVTFSDVDMKINAVARSANPVCERIQWDEFNSLDRVEHDFWMIEIVRSAFWQAQISILVANFFVDCILVQM